MPLESELYQLMEDYGIPVVDYSRFSVQDPLEAKSYPVVLKFESPEVVHKSDVGAVVPGIHNQEALQKARQDILLSLQKEGIEPESGRDHFLVNQMLQGPELYAGVVDDRIFGKTILFGHGGVFLELYRDICYIDTEASEHEIERALSRTKISKLFKGFRHLDYQLSEIVSLIQKLQDFINSNESLIELDLNPIILTQSGPIVADARAREGNPQSNPLPTRNRPHFFDSRRIVIPGATTKTHKPGYAVAKNAINAIRGSDEQNDLEVYAVNPKGGTIQENPIHTTLHDLPDTLDTAVLTIPPGAVVETVIDLVENKGVRNLIIISAGFKESGNQQGEDRLAKIARDYNVNIIGPNCLGYFNAKLNLNLTFATGNIHQGDLALVSQSGAVLASLMDKAWQMGVGFSHIVSVGNMVDLDFAEIIDMLQKEDTCQYIAIYAEGIRYGKEFLQAIRRSSKPIYVFKSGRSEQSRQAAFSHTGNMAGDFDMFCGLLEAAGSRIEQSMDALLLNPAFRPEKILIISNAGGPASILVDYIRERNRDLYELSEQEISRFDEHLPDHWPQKNPVDIIGDARSDRYGKALEIALEMEEVSLIYVLITPQFMTDPEQIARKILSDATDRVVPIFLGGEMMEKAISLLKENQVPVFHSLREATDFL